MNPEVREIAARTQIPVNEFTECPEKGCNSELGEDLEVIDVEVAAVELYCQNCHRFYDVTSRDVDRDRDGYRSASQVFEQVVQ